MKGNPVKLSPEIPGEKMARPKKETTLLDLVEAKRVVSELMNEEDLKISLLDFMRLNLQKFKETGLSRQTIYERLTSGGLELGSFNAFSHRWTRVEKSGVLTSIPSKVDSSVKPSAAEEEIEREVKPARKQEPERSVESKSEDEREVKAEVKAPAEVKKKTGMGLRPIRMPDGTEVEITQTGAKRFKI